MVRRETERCIPKKIRRKRRLWQNYTSSEYYRQDYGGFQAYKEVEKRVKAEVNKTKRKFERKCWTTDLGRWDGHGQKY